MALTTEERLLVNSEVQKRGKNILLAYILLIFLGTLGIHRFYLGKTGSAVAQLVLTIVGWMTVVLIIGFIPLVVVGIWAIVDLFLVPGIIRQQNEEVEREITQELERNKQ